MKQTSFAGLEYAGKKCQTRRENSSSEQFRRLSPTRLLGLLTQPDR